MDRLLTLQPTDYGLQPLQVVLFDAVGTLIDARPPVAEVYWEAGRRFGSRRGPAEIRERFRESFARHCQPGQTSEVNERRRWRAIVGEIFDDVRPAADGIFEELWEHFAKSANWRVFDDVTAVWTALEQRGLRLGLASNFDERLVSVCRDIAPLHRASFLFCSSQLGYSKPCIEFFRAIEASLHLPSHEILLVGDDPEADLLGARRAGWHAVHLDREAKSPIGETIQTLHELLDLATRRHLIR